MASGDQHPPLTDESGKPLNLFLLDGRPATDRKGVPLLNIAGNSLISFSVTTEILSYQDWKGYPLTDSQRRTQDDKNFCPTKTPVPVQTNFKCAYQVFALDGLPLTDASGVPLVDIQGKFLIIFNPKGHPVMDSEGNDVTDKCGRVIFSNEKPFWSKEKVPLRVYDELGRPLTDEDGFPFTNILGGHLFCTDDNRAPTKTVKGYHVKDAEGNMQWEAGFDLTRTPRYYKINKAIICKNSEHGIAFDVCGHPLTDMTGFPLFDLDGKPLVKKKKVWVDSIGIPATIIHKSVYDRDEVTHLRNSNGTPVRLFDKRGYALTDHQGVPLAHACGLILLKFNEKGEPVTDWNGDALFDDMGNPLGSKMFCPCKASNHNEFVANHKGYGVQFFEATGMPLTNSNGVPLLNRYQEFMAIFDSNGIPVRDVKGRDVYDVLGLPIVKSFIKPLLSPSGDPIRLYTKSGKPLTDRAGNVLKSINDEYLLKLNFIGQIVSDSKGGPLYDSQGYPTNLIDKFLSTKSRVDLNCKLLLNLDGSPLCMYGISGEPLTDSRGGVLTDSNGLNLITSSATGIITEKNGQPAYDLDGYTAVKVAGRAVINKIAVYDSYDRPLIGPSGFILKLRSGRELLKFDKAGFPVCTFDGKTIFDCKGHPVFTPSSDISVVPDFAKLLVFGGKIQIFGCDECPLLDITGELLYTSRGIPLIQFDKDHRPRADCIGRPLYDEKGIPIANPGNVWKSQRGVPYRLFDKDGLPLTDPRGKELLDINGIPLIKRGEFGHPKYDKYGNLVCDLNGNYITDSNFVGTTAPPEYKSNTLLESLNKPLRLYDLDGRPLTDECGKSLVSKSGRCLLDLKQGLNKILDFRGRTVFDSRKIPLACDPTIPIITMKGTPMVLYNKDGNPLMSLEGLPINCMDGTSLLSFDEFGRPARAGKSGLFDSCGVSIDSPECQHGGVLSQQLSLMSMEGRPVRIFNNGGHPITDSKGNILFRADGNPVRAGSWGDNPG